MKFYFVLFLFKVVALGSETNNKIHPNKFVGGKNVDHGEEPYHISVHRNGKHVCSGAFVQVNGKHVVITSAHCIFKSKASEYSVVAGDINLHQIHGHAQARHVVRIIEHEWYDHTHFGYDIALLLPDSDFKINKDVQPIALPNAHQASNGKMVISGIATNQSHHLQKILVNWVPDEVCQEAFPDENILPSMLCAGDYKEEGKITCQGESGAPVRAVTGNYLAGIVSWTYACEDSLYPVVSTEMSYFIDWIKNNVN